jgi:hypothetical protein
VRSEQRAVSGQRRQLPRSERDGTGRIRRGMRRGTGRGRGHRAGRQGNGSGHGERTAQERAKERAERHRGRTAGRGAGEERRTKEKPPTTGRLGEGRGDSARSVAPEPVVLSELLFGYVAGASPRDGAKRRQDAGAVIAGRLQLSNRIAQPERTPRASDRVLPVLLFTPGALLNGEALANAVEHSAQTGAEGFGWGWGRGRGCLCCLHGLFSVQVFRYSRSKTGEEVRR